MTEPATQFDRYEILARLGAGGMGEVLKARAVGPHGFEKVVALKRIRPQRTSHGGAADRFIREAQLAAKLQHANIVHVFDFGRYGDELFIVMEHVDGRSLAAVTSEVEGRGERLGLGPSLSLAVAVTRALDYAHRLTDDHGEPLGVVHRDVSPANILISRDGTVKLADFGIAAWGKSDRISLAGKPPYMAPEQLRGDALDGRADLFALGIVLYEMLTGGRRPWPGIVDAQPGVTLQDMGYRPPSAHAEELPAELDALVERLLALDVADRMATAAELQRRLLEVSLACRIVLDPTELGALVGSGDDATAPTLVGSDEREMFMVTGVAEDGGSLLVDTGMVEKVAPAAATTEPDRQAPASTPPAGARAEGATVLAPAPSGPRWLPMALVVAGSVVLAAVLWPEPEPPPPPAATPAATPTAAPTAAPAAVVPVEAAPPSAAIDPVEPVDPAELGAEAAPAAPVEPSPRPGAAGDRGRDRSARAARAEPAMEAARPPAEPAEPAAELAAPDPAAMGALNIHSDPWSEIYVDGVRRGNAPRLGLPVPAGTRRVRLVNPASGLEYSTTVEVGAGQTRLIRADW